MAHLKQPSPVKRILNLTKRLYALETLNTKTLSKELNRTARTIHRDMKKIAEVIPLQNKNGNWKLDTDNLPKDENNFNHILLSSFAKNIGIEVECLEHSNIDSQKITFAIEYKNLPKSLGEAISASITSEEKCSFTYTKDDGSITTRVADPIKIYTENGRWYLIARDYNGDLIKTFNIANITNYRHLKGEKNTLTHKMRDEADQKKSVWSSSGVEPYIVRLYVKPEVSAYIRDIKLHKSQTIHDEHHDGGLEVHCTITHDLEILPAIKKWLPMVHILEPRSLKEELMSDLEYYQDEDGRMA